MSALEYLTKYAYQRRHKDEEPFKLASGGTSFEYLDCRAALSRTKTEIANAHARTHT